MSSPPPPDDVLTEAALHDFSLQLHSVFPLRNVGEFYDEEQLKDRIHQLKENISKNFFSKVWDRDKEQVFSLLKKLRERMNQEVIAVWVAKNKMHTIECVSFLQRRAEMLCKDFEMTLEDQLLLNPHMEMDSLKNFVARQKGFAVTYFDGIWEAVSGSSQIKKERKAKMIKNLDAIGEELLDKHKHFLESKSVNEGKTLVEEVKTILVEKSRHLKSYVDSHPERVSKRYLKAEVEDIKEYLSSGKGSTLRECFGFEDIYSKIVETLEEGIKFLTEEGAEGNASSPEDFIQWVEALHLKLKTYCFGRTDEIGTDDPTGIQQGSAGCDSNERSSWITMHQLLQGDPSGLWEQEEFQPESRTPDIGGGGNNDRTENIVSEDGEETRKVDKTSSMAGDQPEPATAAKMTMKRRRYRPLNSSVTDNDQALMNDCNDTGTHDGPRAKKNKTDPNSSRKISMRADMSEQRQTSGVNRKSDAAEAKPRRSSRLKKYFPKTDPMKGSTDTRGKRKNQYTSFLLGVIPERKDESAKITETLNPPKLKRLRSTESSTGVVSESNEPSPSMPICPDGITSLGGDPPTFQCDLCKKKFRRENSFEYHGKLCFKARGTKEVAFVCEKCQLRFKHRRALNRHMSSHEEKPQFCCSYCEQRCASLQHLKAHVITHSDERPFSCVTCNKSFCMKFLLVRHIQDIHGQPKEDARKQANDASLEYLRKVTNNPNYNGDSSLSVVVSHAIKKANLTIPKGRGTTSLARTTPSRVGSSRAKLPIRIERITNLGGDPPTYRCDTCTKEISKRGLHFHGKYCMNTYLQNKCDHCGKVFPAKANLLVHIRSHTGEKPFKCPTCDKGFAQKCHLRVHIRSHTKEAPFKCEKCEQSFRHRLSLDRHDMLNHEGKLPFGCSYCNQRCPTMSNLMQHVLIHSDERPFHCSTCDKKFSLKFRLLRHLQNVHHQTKDDAIKQANDASAEYLRKVTHNANYDGDISHATVLSHAVKKANLKLPEQNAKKSSKESQ